MWPHRYASVLTRAFWCIPDFPQLQTHFTLTSAQVFSCSDLVTDSECFYTSIMELLDDPEEREEVNLLILWWNR
jgi:hypothetical protein